MDNTPTQDLINLKPKILESLFENDIDPVVLYCEGAIFDINMAAVDFLGYDSKAEMMGLSAEDISPEYQNDGRLSAEKCEELLKKIVQEGRQDFQWTHRNKKGEIFVTEMSGSVVDVSGQLIFKAIFHKKTSYENHEKTLKTYVDELSLHNKILKIVNEGQSLACILKEFILGIEALHPEMLCSIFALDNNGQTLSLLSAPSLPDFYNEAVDGIEIGEGIGSCGEAASLAKVVIVDDIQTHNNWHKYADLASKANLASCWAQPIMDHDKKVLGTFAIYHREAATPTTLELELFSRYSNLSALILDNARRDAELRIAATAFEMQEGIIIIGANKRIIRANHAFEEMTGYYREDIVGQFASIFKVSEHSDKFYQNIWSEMNSKGAWSGEMFLAKNITGEIFPIWTAITAVKEENFASHYVVSFEDITERKAANEKIKQLAFYDTLTELPNRRYLVENISQGIARAHRNGTILAVLMIDLDRFKVVNDTLGHSAGDELLKKVADKLNNQIRDTDMVARLGGDEFVVVLEKIRSKEDAARVAEKIVEDLGVAFNLSQHDEVSIGSSIGISIYPEHGKNVELLMDHADIALYAAKDNGRGCYAYFSEELTRAALEKLKMETRLRYAIENNELRVYYQPQVKISSNEIISAEALVRWLDPRDGLVPPDKFIGIAEDSGLIMPLGEWVLRETCRQGKEWLDAGHKPIVLAVNVSSKQFIQVDMVQITRDILEETGFPAKYLELEVTESSLMDNQERTIEIFNQLHDMGVHLAMDDFGTGYSSLAYLKRFPLDVLKIDKQFIDDVTTDESDKAITATIIAMGRILGFKVLAEGVETQEQLDFLQEHGCDVYQGYFRSKPVEAEFFLDVLNA